jgi:hypothetical protein
MTITAVEIVRVTEEKLEKKLPLLNEGNAVGSLNEGDAVVGDVTGDEAAMTDK